MGDRTADESPMSVGTGTIGVQESRSPRSGWLADGQCCAYAGGHSRRARYDASSKVPDGLVM